MGSKIGLSNESECVGWSVLEKCALGSSASCLCVCLGHQRAVCACAWVISELFVPNRNEVQDTGARCLMGRLTVFASHQK